MIVRYEKAGVIGLLDNAGHLILAQVKLKGQTTREKKTKESNQKLEKRLKRKDKMITKRSPKDKKQKIC